MAIAITAYYHGNFLKKMFLSMSNWQKYFNIFSSGVFPAICLRKHEPLQMWKVNTANTQSTLLNTSFNRSVIAPKNWTLLLIKPN